MPICVDCIDAKENSTLLIDESESVFAQKRHIMEKKPVLNILKLILDGSPLAEVLKMIAELVESQNEDTLCTIWLPDEDGKQLHCAAAPKLPPDFSAQVGPMFVGPTGASCGTAAYRKEPVYVTDILSDVLWKDYRHLFEPYGIRAAWSRPLLGNDGGVLGTFAILYREARDPGAVDLELIENASRIAAIAIERHINEERSSLERDRLRLLLEITNSMTSKLDLGHLIRSLSTDLLSVIQCDYCALLLPDADSGELRATTLYHPHPRGSFCDGMIVPIHGSACGITFRTGESHNFSDFEEIRDDPEGFGSSAGQRFYQRVMAEGLVSGCDVPLIGRSGIVGVLMALSRSRKIYKQDNFAFLGQVARQVGIAIENALDYENAIKDRDREAKQRLYLEEEVRAEFGDIVGESPALKAALNLVSVVAATDSSVLITGETGTGKELVARAIHNLSTRRKRAFVKLNCAAIPLGLLESELFGHEKGAFTGAIAQKMGRFELANNGTLFLDEVGDIPLELQSKLLRVLQEQEFEKLGSNRTHKVDVRLIAATHRDLASMVKQLTFREDLYYRLKVFPIHVPPLRQRSDDIPQLVRHFVARYAQRMDRKIDQIPTETMEAMVRYHWPGNVRELQNFVERAVILSPNSVLRAPVAELEPFAPRQERDVQMSGLAEVERDHIVLALEASNWIVGGPNGAAARLGMQRTTLAYRMRKLRINRPVPFANEVGRMSHAGK
ncbi:MAG: sigma 54-interacting transcriptional regulator [Acidobacteriaceae bacterium]